MKTKNERISSDLPPRFPGLLPMFIDTETLEERQADPDREAFPYRDSLYDTDFVLGGVFPWHWHGEAECFQIMEGSLFYGLQEQEIRFDPGDVGFLNRGILHMTHPPEGQKSIARVHVFSPEMLFGSPGSAIGRKYLVPVISSSRLKILRFPAESPEAGAVRSCLDDAFRESRQKQFGWELRVREAMTRAWLVFLEHVPQADSPVDPADNERLMLMLRYIAEHCGEPIRLGDLAAAAHISEKECERCFRRQIRMLPFDYLMDYRLEKAKAMLAGGRESITAVSEKCGFESSSYFSKCFRRHYHLTPREYRNSRQARPEPAENPPDE